MFPLYIFESREEKEKEKKEENVYLLFVWFAKEEKCVFFTFIPSSSISNKLSKPKIWSVNP